MLGLNDIFLSLMQGLRSMQQCLSCTHETQGKLGQTGTIRNNCKKLWSAVVCLGSHVCLVFLSVVLLAARREACMLLYATVRTSTIHHA